MREYLAIVALAVRGLPLLRMVACLSLLKLRRPLHVDFRAFLLAIIIVCCCSTTNAMFQDARRAHSCVRDRWWRLRSSMLIMISLPLSLSGELGLRGGVCVLV